MMRIVDPFVVATLLILLGIAPSSASAEEPASMPAASEPGPSSQPTPAADAPSSMPASGAASLPASMPSTTSDNRDADDAPKDMSLKADAVDTEVGTTLAAKDAALAESEDKGGGFLDVFRSKVPVPSAGTYADRPGFSDSPTILPSGAGLIAIGVGAAANTSDTLLLRAGKVTVPDVRLRFGVFGVLEAEAGLTYDLVAPTEFEALASGRVRNATLGGRILVVEEGEFWPSAAVLVRFYLPTQALVFDESGVEARAMMSKTFLDRVTFGGNLGATYFGTDEQLGALGSGFVSVALGLGLSVFAQGVVQSELSLPLELDPNVQVEGGGSYNVSDWLKLDIFSNVELLPTLGSWSVSAGATMYFPGHLWGIGK